MNVAVIPCRFLRNAEMSLARVPPLASTRDPPLLLSQWERSTVSTEREKLLRLAPNQQPMLAVYTVSLFSGLASI